MVKYLTEQEYDDILNTNKYGVIHFMGGISGTDKSATVYLYADKMVLISDDEIETLIDVKAIQNAEAKEYVKKHGTVLL